MTDMLNTTWRIHPTITPEGATVLATLTNGSNSANLLMDPATARDLGTQLIDAANWAEARAPSDPSV